MENCINLLKKLGNARLDFQQADIKKTGKNKHYGYMYYELHDIIPKINELSNKYGFIGTVSFSTEAAILKIIDADDPKSILEFTSPMAGVKLSGAHEVQNMGAVQTYMRRYLYMMAFEIVENDTYDAEQGKEKVEKPPCKSMPKNSNENQERKQNNEQSQGAETEKANLNKEIGIILKSVNPEKAPYFSNTEIDTERKIFESAVSVDVIRKQHERLRLKLQEREKAYHDSIPFGDGFKDDIPWEQDSKPNAKEQLDIF